jgi:hypothetical protein
MIVIKRFAYHNIDPEWGTFGTLEVVPVGFRCVTVERPWKGNTKNISCIPIGVYEIKLGTHYGKPGKEDDYTVYELFGVEDRDNIEIHIANYMTDVKGCIGVGRYVYYSEKKKLPGVANSRDTFRELMDAMAGIERSHVRIENYEGGKI